MTQPGRMLENIADAMRETLLAAKGDERVPKEFLATIETAWGSGLSYAS